MTASRCSYVPSTTTIDPTAPGGIEAMLAFHRATFGTAVMEGTDDDADDDSGDDDTGAPQVGEHGFPENTPVAEMTAEQQAAYWQHKARKHEDRAKATKDYDAIKAERDRLKAASQTDAEKATEQAVKDAEARATAAALASVAPRLVAAEFKAAGAGKIPDAQLAALISGAHAPSFLTDAGEVDTDKVTQYLAPFVTSSSDDGKGGARRRPDMGQGNRSSQKATGLDAGASAYAARHPQKQSA